MEQKKLEELFAKIAEGNDEERLGAAMEIINSAEDQTLKNELFNFAITMATTKNSVEQDEVIDALKLYFKKQISLIFVQAFTYGQKYQHAIDLVALKDIFLPKEETEQENIQESE